MKEISRSYLALPVPAVHASTLLPRGNVCLCAGFGGTQEGTPDVDIWLSRRVGGDWEPAQRISAADDIPHWNPVLTECSDGRILLTFKCGPKIPDWVTYCSASCDGGLTWSDPAPLVSGDDSGGRGPVKNKILMRSDGVWVAPASVERGLWRCFCDLSHDEGKTWQRGAFVAAPEGVGMIQPTLWEHAGGISMLTRTTVGRIYRADSVDGGVNWCEAYPTELPNNNSGLDLAQTPDGTLYLACNPIPGDPQKRGWAGRNRLALLKSRDNGLTWETALMLEDEPEGEYSYPAVVCEECSDGRVLLNISYTWRREKFAVRVFEL